MKAIDIKFAEMAGASSRRDGSIRFSVITPELTLDQRSTLLGLHGKNVRVMLEPIDVPVSGIDEVATEIDQKTPCQRLRACIYIWWTQDGKREVFDVFYAAKMEKMIEWVKAKLDA